MTRGRVLFIFGFLISLGAGFVIGMAVGRSPQAAQAVPAKEPATKSTRLQSLDDELDLTTEQRAKVKEIFSVVRPPDSGRNDALRALRRERDEASHQLVPDDRKAS